MEIQPNIRHDVPPSRPRFRLRTLGGLSLEGRDAEVPAAVNQRKRLAFLALLAAVGPRGIARDKVLLLLWPESTTERARGALYQLLYIVRQAFGDGSVVGTDELSLDSSVVGSDVAEFSAAIAHGDLVRAIDLYGGPFLDGVHVPGATELDRWAEQKRQELARAYQNALGQLVAQSTERGDHPAAIAYAERLVAADPLSGRATVLLMEALAASGDVPAALDRARTHAAFVREELDADVDPTVTALVMRLRANPGVPRASAPVPVESKQAVHQPPIQPRTRNRRSTRAIVWTVAGVAAMAIALVAAMRRKHDPVIEFAVLADFETAAPDSQVADALTETMRRVLTESRALRVLPEGRAREARERGHIPPNTRLTKALARQVAVNAGVRGVIAGSLKTFGGAYAISLELLSPATGDVLTSVHGSGIATGRVFDALDTMTRRLREQAGDDAEAIRAQPQMLALTSTSLEAMTDYVAALRLPRDSAARAASLLREAIRLDSTFASALWRLGFYIENDKRMSDAEHRALLARAWNHRQGLTEYEQLRLEIAYKVSPDGIDADIDQHLEHLRRVVDRYPNAEDANILADMYMARRDLANAERAYRLVVSLDPTRRDAYASLIVLRLRQKRVAEAREELDAFTRKFGPRLADRLDMLVSYAEGRQDHVREVAQRMTASTGGARLLSYFVLAELDLLDGHIAAWEKGLGVWDELAKASGAPSPGLRPERLLERFWVRNRPDEALRMLDESLAAHPSLRSNLTAIEFLAQLGRPDSARALLAARGKSDFTVYNRGTDTLPAAAWIDLAEGRPRDAAVKFRESLRFSGRDAPSQTRYDAELGLAFERAGLADSAVKVYEHYLNGPPTFEVDNLKLVWVLEHVAALYEKRGDRAKATAAYARVAELWKDADPELQPRVQRARERAVAAR